MAYIIENVQLFNRSTLKRISLVIKDNRIVSMMPHVKNYHFLKMNGSEYIMTPPHVFLDSTIPHLLSFEKYKVHFTNEIIKKGCTVLLTNIELKTERLLKEQLRNLHEKLLNCPIDFLTAVKVKPSQITVSFMRLVKREKIPAIFVEVTAIDELEGVPWGWIREAMFPYQCPFVPIFTGTEHLRTLMREQWYQCMRVAKVPYLKDELAEREPLEKTNLEKMGIIPVKSHIHAGAEVSYNLYKKTGWVNFVDEKGRFLYDNSRLEITVHKGNVIRAGDQVWFHPGFGEHVTIKLPLFFAGES